MDGPVIPETQQQQQQQQQPKKQRAPNKVPPPPSDALKTLMQRRAAALTAPGVRTRTATAPAAFDLSSKSKVAWRDELIHLRLSDALPKKKQTGAIKDSATLYEIMVSANEFASHPDAPPAPASFPLTAPASSFDEDVMARQVAKDELRGLAQARLQRRAGPDAPLVFADLGQLGAFLHDALVGEAGIADRSLCRLSVDDVVSAVEPLTGLLSPDDVIGECKKVHREAKNSSVKALTMASMVTDVEDQDSAEPAGATGPSTPRRPDESRVLKAVSSLQQRAALSEATKEIALRTFQKYREKIAVALAKRRTQGMFHVNEPTPGGPASEVPAPRRRRAAFSEKFKTALKGAWGSVKTSAVAFLGYRASRIIRRMIPRRRR
jgi:hypothetical protein